MSYTFQFIEYTKEKISGRDYICIYFWNKNQHIVHRVFKLYSPDLINILNNLTDLEDISQYITYAIKRGRDNKTTIALDIKFL